MLIDHHLSDIDATPSSLALWGVRADYDGDERLSNVSEMGEITIEYGVDWSDHPEEELAFVEACLMLLPPTFF